MHFGQGDDGNRDVAFGDFVQTPGCGVTPFLGDGDQGVGIEQVNHRRAWRFAVALLQGGAASDGGDHSRSSAARCSLATAMAIAASKACTSAPLNAAKDPKASPSASAKLRFVARRPKRCVNSESQGFTSTRGAERARGLAVVARLT